MKYADAELLSGPARAEATAIGQRIGRLRRARGLRQADAALRAGLSRPVAGRIEAGDPGRTLGQLLRYLDAIAPGTTLLELLSERDPSLALLAAREATQRVRVLSPSEREALDF
jgi:transcriptional regulator with XRE-family HTH domain